MDVNFVKCSTWAGCSGRSCGTVVVSVAVVVVVVVMVEGRVVWTLLC